MKPEQSNLLRVPTILFFVAGVAWAGIVAAGGGVVLVWAALACFASGALLVMWASSWLTKPVVAASSVFGVIVALYQVYVGLTVVGGAVQSLAFVSVPLFLVLTVLYLYLFYANVLKQET